MKRSNHNTIVALTSAALISACFASDETSEEIQKHLLDSDKVHSIPVSKERITTISFPDSIDAIDGAFMSTQANQAGLFQLAHTKGSSFFSLRCLTDREEAQTNLNVRWEDKTYVLLIKQSVEPKLSVIFQRPPVPVKHQVRKNNAVTPASLVGLLDKSKAYHFFKEHHPNTLLATQYVDHRKQPQISKQKGFEIRIQEVFRFEDKDTLVFHLNLINPTDQAIHYRADSFSIQAGDHSYPQSISDASGEMKPKTQTTVYVAITGTPYGGKNHLSPENQFSVRLALQELNEALPQPIEITPNK